MARSLVIPLFVGACFAIGAACAGAPPPPPQVFQPASAPPAPEVKVSEPKAAWCDSVVEMQTSRQSGVTSVWLQNGVRVHHRQMDRQPGRVAVTIALCGGKLLEEATTRGLTEVAAGVLDDWDAAAPEASRITHMDGRDMRIDAAAGQDAITIRLAGAKADLEPALGVVHAMLTNPTVTAQTVEAARDQVIRELRRRASDQRAVVSEAVNQGVVPAGDVRLQPPNERSLRSIGVEQVRDWVVRHTKEGGEPIEVAIVGNISLAEALRVADAAFGALPARARPTVDTYALQRTVALPQGPVRTDVRVEEMMVGAGRATVVRGCFGPDMSALADQRALRAVLRVATARLKDRLAPPRFSVGPDGPGSGLYMSAFRGLGMALVTVSVKSDEADLAGAAIDEELERLGTQGPTPEELAKAAEELARAAENADRDIRYWSAAVSRCTSLGMEPDEIGRAAVFYRSLAPEQARDALAKYLQPKKRIAITVRAVGAP